MEAPEPSAPYRLVYSEAVKLRLRELGDEAFAQGDGSTFTAAIQKLDRLLRLYPQFGEPQIDLATEPGVIYVGIIRPLCVRYAVYENRRLVLVVALPLLLPMARPDSASEQ